MTGVGRASRDAGSITRATSGCPCARSHTAARARGESGPSGADQATTTASEIVEMANMMTRLKLIEFGVRVEIHPSNAARIRTIQLGNGLRKHERAASDAPAGQWLT